MHSIRPHLLGYNRITYLNGLTPHDIAIGELKTALLGRFGMPEVAGDQLFLGHGSFNIMERIIHKMINPGRMLGLGPQFNEVPSEFVAAGGQYKSVNYLQGDYLGRLHSEIDSGGYDVVYIDNPNNPTGRHLWRRHHS